MTRNDLITEAVYRLLMAQSTHDLEIYFVDVEIALCDGMTDLEIIGFAEQMGVIDETEADELEREGIPRA